ADFANDPYLVFAVADSTCTNFVEGGSDYIEVDLPDANDARTLPITPGWSIPAGDSLCAAELGGVASPDVTTFGYLVPSSAVPPLALVKGANASPRTHR